MRAASRKVESRRVFRAPRTALAWVLISAAMTGTAGSQSSSSREANLQAPGALAAESSAGHRNRQKRPIELGTSGSSSESLIPGVLCCGGTLGALLKKKDRYFVLSNNHVLGRLNQAVVGEDVLQPGLFDTKCKIKNKNYIGTLAGFKKIKFSGTNKADAAIAETTPELVSDDGAIHGIGIPGNKTVKPQPGDRVVKSGRSTGVTHGEVEIVNLSGGLTFSKSCGSDEEVGAQFKQLFTVVDGNFSAGGDSGAVIYEDVASCPRAMGHLIGGSFRFTIATLMKNTLKAVKRIAPKGKAELVGCDPNARVEKQGRNARLERAVRTASQTQRRHEERILALPGVVAIGIVRSPGNPDEAIFRVLVEESESETADAVPSNLEGIPVEVVVSGPIRARGCPNGELGSVLGGLEISALSQGSD